MSISRGTRVFYNGIEMVNVLTKAFDQSARYDASDTDKECDGFVMRFVGHVHANDPDSSTIGTFGVVTGKQEQETFKDPLNAANVRPNTAVANELTIRQLLMTPRKEFRLRVGEDTLLWAMPWASDGKPGLPSSSDTGRPAQSPSSRDVGDPAPVSLAKVGAYMPRDVNNGPKPRRVNVTRITGTQLLEVEFEIEVCLAECVSSGLNKSGILSNRWTVRETMNTSFYTTRTIAGRLKCASNFLDPIRSMRGVVMPKLQDGFRRESVELIQSADGSIVDYAITDQEIWAAAPYPCTMWDGEHTRTTGQGGASQSEMLTFRLEGDKFASKIDMMLLAGRIIQQKLATAQAQSDGTQFMMNQCDVIDHLTENVIEVRIEVTTTPADDQLAAIVAIGNANYLRPLTKQLKQLGTGQPPGGKGTLVDYDQNRSRLPDLFGSASPMESLRSYLQNPCMGIHSVSGNADRDGSGGGTSGGGTSQGRDTQAQNDGNRIIDVKVGEYPANQTPFKDPVARYNDDAKKSVYTFYEMQVTQCDDYNVIQMPIAGNSITRRPDAPTSTIVRMAPPTSTRLVHVLAKRAGRWPRIPKANSFQLNSGQRFYPMGKAQIRMKTPYYDATRSQKIYEVEVSIPYALTRPTRPGEYLIAGSMPFDTTTVGDNGMKYNDVMADGLTDNFIKKPGQ